VNNPTTLPIAIATALALCAFGAAAQETRQLATTDPADETIVSAANGFAPSKQAPPSLIVNAPDHADAIPPTNVIIGAEGSLQPRRWSDTPRPDPILDSKWGPADRDLPVSLLHFQIPP